MKRLFTAVTLLSFAAFSTGCSHMVTIRGPEGSKVRVDGLDYGASASFTDMGSTGKTYMVEVDKPGFQKRSVPLKQEWNAGCVAASVIGGLIFFVPFVGLLWCQSLPQDNYVFELDPLQGAWSYGGQPPYSPMPGSYAPPPPPPYAPGYGQQPGYAPVQAQQAGAQYTPQYPQPQVAPATYPTKRAARAQ